MAALTSSKFWKLTAFGGLLLSTGSLYLTRYTRNIQSTQCSSISKPLFTLYQYQTCPFCCKTRAVLDYYGFDYKIVEVNPLSRKEIKFSKYRKVPILVSGKVQINDSSLIASVLRSSMINNDLSLSETLDMYPEVTYYDTKNRELTERANKYFLMYKERKMDVELLSKLREEREWREWVDTHLVHTFSPNIYRSMRESFQSFHYISSIDSFSLIEKLCIRYLGSVAMYILGRRLKKKYNLKDDVRLSLYECCDEWLKAIGPSRSFMGGEEPNLADIAVYGALSALEGRDTFNDMISHTNISQWYFAVKDRVQKHQGKTMA